MTDLLTGRQPPGSHDDGSGPESLAADETPTSVVTVLARGVVPMLLLLGLFAVLARVASQPLSNSDTFFHLRFGHEFLTGAWSLREPGSVTSLGTARWVPTQWLPQVVMAQLESWWGLPAVAWFSGLQLLLLAVTVFLTARRWSDRVVAAPLTMVVIITCAPGLSMRPQVMSYVLVAITSSTWLAARESRRTPWILVPLTWVWATYHGMWPIGIAVGIAAVVGIGLERRATRGELARHLAVPALSLLVAGLTPLGPSLYGAVLEVSSRSQYFSEWGPPAYTNPNCLALLAVLGTTVVVMLRRSPISWTHIALLSLTCACAVYSSRTVPVAGAMLAPIAATTLQGLLGPTRRAARGEQVLVVGTAAIVLAVLAAVVPRTAGEPAPQPDWVRPSLSALPAGTPVLGDSGYGGYLMWAFPQLDVVMSGYGDIYTDAELERNSDIEGVHPGWDQQVKDTGARLAMVSADSPLGYALEKAGWRLVHEDVDVLLLEAPDRW